MKKKITWFLLMQALPFILMAKMSSFSLYELKCEQEENPIGIENLHPCFSWKIFAEERGFQQKAYQILVSDTFEELAKESGKIWDSGKVVSSQSILVPFDGKVLQSAGTYYWKVRIWDKNDNVSAWSESSRFLMGLLDEKAWGKAAWIAMEKEKEKVIPAIHEPSVNEKLGDKPIGFYKLPQFRKEFKTKKEVKQALLFATGLGHFDLFLNGEKVGNNFLDPGWSQYNKNALYVSFDITNALKTTDNTIGVMLGNGFYNIPRERYFKLLGSFGAPKMKLCLRLTYVDGTVEEVVSDKNWKVSASPITYSSIYGGEDYDATLEQKGWMLTGFRDKHWQNAIIVDSQVTLKSQTATPLKVRERIPVVRRYKNGKNYWLYDLGQNFSGIIHLKVKGNNGQTVLLRPAELLNPDSTVNQSASGEPFYFSYKIKGEEKTENWQPQFTYYGFRYVQLEGAVPAGQDNPDNLPEVTELYGLHTCNSAPEAGKFTCSNPMFNRIYELIDWAMRSNMASVLTDCPHREKLGWLEEAHLMQYSLQYRYNLSRLYMKIMQDMQLAQTENGMIPTIAPEYVRFSGGFEDTPEWGSSFIICPWYIYQWYGDKRLIETYYPQMKRYLEYLSSRANKNIVAYGLGDWFDIGPGNPGYAQLTSNGVTATAIYYYNTTILAKMANLLGKTTDAERFELLATAIKKSFNETFFDPKTGIYDRNSQTANAMVLYLDLAEPENQTKVLQNLTADIRGRNNALTAGDVGYRYVLRALEKSGESELIYDMNSQYNVPGYGWQLAHGATALTESWQAYGFVSNNHFMLGHLMEWLFSGLGGIRQQATSTGFNHILINPQQVGDIKSANTSYESPYGLIRCDWEDRDTEFILKIEIPANSDATVMLPTSNINSVTEYGKPIAGHTDIRIIGTENNKVKLQVGSGYYLFSMKK